MPLPSFSAFLPFRLQGVLALALALCGTASSTLDAQPRVTPWGNVTGMLLEGDLLAFESSLRVVDADWSGYVQSSKYNWEGKPSFTQEGKAHVVRHAVQGTSVYYTTRVTDTGKGTARIDLQADLQSSASSAEVFYTVTLPAADYLGATLEFLGSSTYEPCLLRDRTGERVVVARVKAKGFRIVTARRSFELLADEETEVLVRQDLISQPDYLNDPQPRVKFISSDPKLKAADFQVYLRLPSPKASGAVSSFSGYTLRAGGVIDREPVHFQVEALRPGSSFAGIGGNFRMQFPELDGQVVDYCLDTLSLAWGRVAFPWAEWQPEELGDASEKVLSGGMSPSFYAQLEIARDLARRRIPLIASVWAPPAWAVDSTVKIPKGVKLDENKLQKCADSIANWLVFIKRHYGIEVALFSFNETDYGVEVHQNGREHALANRVLGETFARRGLSTKMLLGDTGACTSSSHKLVEPSVADASLLSYLGGIAFHTYHGLTPEALELWAASARKARLPLFCTEGGPDSAAHRYPLIFVTPWFAQLEIDQYLRIAATCQATSIMPWQLNADYSPLQGGGLYGDEGPLRPTQRYWNLKQLGTLASGAFWLPVSADRPNISCAALGDRTRNAFALHVTNNGATRKASLSGIPAGVKRLRVYVTDETRGMQLQSVRSVVNGALSFPLEAQSFTSLISE